MFDIREDDLEGQAVRALLAVHISGMRTATPPEFSFALDLSGLKTPEITVWTAWDRETLVGLGAMKRLDNANGKVKSMRTAPGHLRRGVAAALLDHIIAQARALGLTRLMLETGTGDEFQAALALYRKRGFLDGEPFADYRPSPFNQFLHLDL